MLRKPINSLFQLPNSKSRKWIIIYIAMTSAGCSTISIPKSNVPTGMELITHKEVNEKTGLTIGLLGNTNVLISDGKHAVLIDGYFTRQNSLATVARSAPDLKQIKSAIKNYNIPDNLDAIVVTHSHNDHALDVAPLAVLTKAVVMGSPSTGKILEGYKAQKPASCQGKFKMYRFCEVKRGKNFVWKNDHFEINMFATAHSGGRKLISRLLNGLIKGEIDKPVETPTFAWTYKEGAVYHVWIKHIQSNRAFIIQSSTTADFPLDSKADVTFFGLGNLSELTPKEMENLYWHFVTNPESSLVIPTHWENFFRKPEDDIKPRKNILDRLDKAKVYIESAVANDPNVNLFWLKPDQRLLLH